MKIRRRIPFPFGASPLSPKEYGDYRYPRHLIIPLLVNFLLKCCTLILQFSHGFVLSDNNYDETPGCERSDTIKSSKLKEIEAIEETGIIVGTWDLYFNEIIHNLISLNI